VIISSNSTAIRTPVTFFFFGLSEDFRSLCFGSSGGGGGGDIVAGAGVFSPSGGIIRESELVSGGGMGGVGSGSTGSGGTGTVTGGVGGGGCPPAGSPRFGEAGEASVFD
jgi:hypothetical protein